MQMVVDIVEDDFMKLRLTKRGADGTVVLRGDCPTEDMGQKALNKLCVIEEALANHEAIGCPCAIGDTAFAIVKNFNGAAMVVTGKIKEITYKASTGKWIIDIFEIGTNSKYTGALDNGIFLTVAEAIEYQEYVATSAAPLPFAAYVEN